MKDPHDIFEQLYTIALVILTMAVCIWAVLLWLNCLQGRCWLW